MDAATVISTLPPELKSQDFAFLRSEGLGIIQALAAKTWTDHNLHDPGITMLEAMCYAITEAGLRTGIDIRDLLASSSQFYEPQFFTAARVLPTAPVTITDLRKILIDHPLVNNAWFFPLKPLPLGRYSALLEFADDTLNSNNFTEQVSLLGPPPKTYTIDIAFPHWDDEDVIPLREDVTVLAISFSGLPGNEWNEIETNTSFFARALVTFQPPVGAPQQLNLWIVAQITTEMEDPITEAPLVLQQLITLISDFTADKPLDKLNKRVLKAYETMRVIRRHSLLYRNLCEDIGEFNAVRQQEVGVTAIIETGAGINTEQLVAEIFYSIDQLISPSLHFQTLDEQLEQLGSADAIFNGPLTDGGFLDNTVIGSQQITSVLYTSDILRLIYQLRNTSNSNDIIEREDTDVRRIISVRGLSLSNFLDNRPISTRARDCLQLVKSQRHIPRLSLSKSRIVIFRNGIKINYDFRRVLEIFEAKKLNDIQDSSSEVHDFTVPGGEVYPLGEYYPIQNDLPMIYGVGEAGLPTTVSATRQAMAKQLKGYLFFFEQLLAGFQSQLVQFNSFFSPDPGIRQTLFQQPLYNLPQIAPLFTAFTGQSVTDWQNFQEDAENVYAKFLKTGVETREQFLERRNTILDHLLAALGEDMRERSALVLRLSVQVAGGELMSLPDLLEAQKQNRLTALDDLIKDKSAYYFDIPDLNLNKPQAYGHPLWRIPQLLTISETTGGFAWQITDIAGSPLFRQFAVASSYEVAQRAAEQALKLGTEANRYSFRIEPVNRRRLELRANPAADPIAESVTTYGSDGAAGAAILEAENILLDIWMGYTLIPLELRLYHLLGIDLKERRLLIHEQADYIDIFDEPIANPDNRQRFRLRALPALPGSIMLDSADNYPGLTEPQAIAAATTASELMIDYGMEARNYRVEKTGANTFILSLVTPAGVTHARSPVVFATNALAEEEAERIRHHLFRLFSSEGLYIVEHHLLFPPATIDTALEIPGQKDPYSFQLTVILPSGYARDFSVANSVPQPSRPSLYRNEEFRKYAEQQVRKHCPAHIMVRILWVDISVPGTPVSLLDPSINTFEKTYLTWLRAVMTDETDAVSINAARNALAGTMNILYTEYFTI